jgi:hypothetical protein
VYPFRTNGVRRRRSPVTDAIALATAGAMTGTAISPNPVGLIVDGTTCTSMAAGASRFRISR